MDTLYWNSLSRIFDCRDEVSPQDLVSRIWLQSIERQDHLLLIVEPRLEPFEVCQMQCQEFFMDL